MTMSCTDILKELIRQPSVNPMGRDLTGPEFFEGRMTDYLVAFFERLGVQHERIEVADGRCNVVARYNGTGPTILFDAHQDTVPVDNMTIDPFEPVEENGRIYGRGACDVKGGMAAMLSAFCRLVKEQPAGAATVIMSCTCDEERSQLGLYHLVECMQAGNRPGILHDLPDVAVVAEPTGLDIVVAHKGCTRWKLRTRGKAAHSSSPTAGVSAIYSMARVISALEEYAQRLERESPAHPLVGSPTLSVGLIEGGASVNTVPAECWIEIDRRVIPGEDGRRVIEPIDRMLHERLPDVEFEMLPPTVVALALPDDNNHAWADRLLRHIQPIAGRHSKVGVPYGTHASRLAEAGVPSFVFGPGSIAQAHTEDEWINAEQLQQAAEILFEFACQP
jgi:succinyl-diaminopimelate desuccinylase